MPAALVSSRREAFRRIYFHPASILRIMKTLLLGLRPPSQLWYTLKSGASRMASLVLSREENR